MKVVGKLDKKLNTLLKINSQMLVMMKEKEKVPSKSISSIVIDKASTLEELDALAVNENLVSHFIHNYSVHIFTLKLFLHVLYKRHQYIYQRKWYTLS